LDLPQLTPLQLDGMNWYVVTETNFEEVMSKIKSSGLQPVVFSLDEKGYENLSVNMTKIRAYIAQQKAIIVALKEYYKVPDNSDPESAPTTKLIPGTGMSSQEAQPAAQTTKK
jgi:hypothetical protein